MRLNKILLFVCVFFVSCAKKDALPPQTAQGSNNFGCLINDVLFTQGTSSFGANFSEESSLTLTYNKLIIANAADNNKYIFRVEAVQSDKGLKKTVGISGLNIEALEIGKSYSIVNKDKEAFSASYKEEKSGNLKIFTATDGELIILKVDKKFIAGIFSFNAKTKEGDKVEIKSGRFDVSLPRKVSP